VRLWRWRSNPLRRRSDRVEAWIVLLTWILALVSGVLLGLVTSGAMEHGLAVRRAEARPVSAVLTEDATTSGSDGDMAWVKVRWIAADGSRHTGRTQVPPSSAAGARVTVWTDPEGHLVSKPPTAAEARMQAALGGVLVGLSVGTGVLVGGRLGRGCLDRRRMADWEAEWKQVGPQWRKRMTG